MDESKVVEIRDTETNQGIDWSTIFFRLHHYCNLSKSEIFEYSFPQIMELMRQTHLHIQFEVRMKANPFGMLGGGASDESESLPAGEGDYEEMTEDDLNNFARALGGV